MPNSWPELASLLEALPEGVLAHDGSSITFANRAAAAILGCGGAAELLGRDVAEVVSVDGASARVRRRDGSEATDVESSWVPFGERGTIVVLRPITAAGRTTGRSAELESFAALTDVLIRGGPPRDVAAAALETLVRFAACDMGAVYLRDSPAAFTLLAVHGTPPDFERRGASLRAAGDSNLQAVLRGEAVFLEAIDDSAHPLVAFAAIRSSIVLPLLVGERSFGFVAICAKVAQRIPPNLRRSLLAMSFQVATALAIARRDEERARRLAVSDALARLLRAATEADDAGRILREVVEQGIALVGGEYGVYRELTPEGTLRVVTSAGFGERHPRPEIHVSDRLRPMLDGGTVVVTHLEPEDETARRSLEAGIVSFVAAPLFSQGHCVGGFGILSSRPRDYDDEAVRLFGFLVREAGLVLDSIRLRQRLRALLGEAERKNRELESFLYTASHELKTPLSVVRGASEILETDLAGHLTTDVRSLLEAISGSAIRMEQSLETLLELSRIGLVSNPYEKAAGGELVREALEIAGWATARRNLRVDTEVDAVELVCDRLRVIEVIVNLLTNAAKYGGDPSDPRAVVRLRREGSEAVFEVEDNGAPLHADGVSALFEPFRRGPGSEDSDGSGLGLYISRRIVRSHGGEIRIHPGKERGNRFEVRLPLRPPNPV